MVPCLLHEQLREINVRMDFISLRLEITECVEVWYHGEKWKYVLLLIPQGIMDVFKETFVYLVGRVF